MNEKDAEALLQYKIPNDQSDAPERKDLLKALEYLPLAITQAGAYLTMRETTFTIPKYLTFLSQSEDILLDDMGDLRRDSTATNSILKTLQISFDWIKNNDSPAADLLSLMSVLHRQGIPRFLLGNNLRFENALATLINFSLITSETDGETFGMH